MLEKLSKHHDLWLKMLNNMGCNNDVAKDIVQDMYLKLHRLVKDPKKIMYGDDINRYYVFITLRNLYYSYLKKEKNNIFYELYETDEVDDVDYDYEEDEAFNKLTKKINDIVSTWKKHDILLFDLYFNKCISLRKISKKSKIGVSWIHRSVLYFKEVLTKELSEDLIDYYNKDYTKI